MNDIDTPYLDLLRLVLAKGKRVPTRAILASTGLPIHALSVFGAQARWNLADGFPALTTKKLSFKAVVAELLWFLEGSTNVATLHEHDVHIWDQWAGIYGDVGPVYGKQWRSWGPEGRDQIHDLVLGIVRTATDPFASVRRRLLLTAWNPDEVHLMGLPVCHVLAQFNVCEGVLSCHLYQRSADAFLGVPFNIASYALLTHILASDTGLQVGDFVHSFGDLHIYENHLDQVREQITRTPRPAPRLQLPSIHYQQSPVYEQPFRVRRADGTLRPLTVDDIALDGYQHWPALKGEVAV